MPVWLWILIIWLASCALLGIAWARIGHFRKSRGKHAAPPGTTPVRDTDEGQR